MMAIAPATTRRLRAVAAHVAHGSPVAAAELQLAEVALDDAALEPAAAALAMGCRVIKCRFQSKRAQRYIRP